mgnify:FL=1
MSKNFLRVKRDILKDMADIAHHTQESWAEIMLKHSQFLTTVEDQQSFWNFILNPSDERDYKSPEFYTYDPMEVNIPEFQKLCIKGDDDEKMEEVTLKNVEVRNGLTSYISTQVE